MRKFGKLAKAVPAVALSASLLFVAGCGGSDSDSDKKADAPKSDTAASAPAKAAEPEAAPAGSIQVQLGEYMFKPSTITAKPGKVTLYLDNIGVVEHDLAVTIDGANKKSPVVQPGAKAAFELGDLKAGTYKVLCDLPGHAQSGMVGKLIVK